MIILPDRNQPRGKILLPMRLRDWSPSDEHGHFAVCRWCVRARLNDGHIVRELWFDDRDEADAFLVSRLLGRRWPNYEPLEYPATWEILVFVTLTANPGTTNQTVARWGDYTATGSVWNTIGGGAAGNVSGGAASGGGGGAFSRVQDLTLPTTITYTIGAGNASQGGDGGATWWNGTAVGSASVSAYQGSGSVTTSGGSGGAAINGIGTLKKSGGNGGTSVVGGSAGGGGGAGGQDADGAAGAAAPFSSGSAGGAGNNSLNGGGTAGAAGGGAGGNGSNLAAGVGSGGGGGGRISAAGGPGGLYGGGGGAACGGALAPGAGAQGVIYGTYTPGSAAFAGLRFNMAR